MGNDLEVGGGAEEEDTMSPRRDIGSEEESST